MERSAPRLLLGDEPGAGRTTVAAYEHLALSFG
jgi:hypothetical protein